MLRVRNRDVLFVVGVGLKKEHLTDEAKKVISRAKKVYGSAKAIKIAEDWIVGEKVIMKKFGEEIYREIERESEESDVVVLSTGDPMVAGLGKFFRDAEIVPGISSVQVALGRIKADLCEVSVLNAHSQEPGFSEERNLMILAKKGVRLEFLGKRMIVLENLEGEDEKIYQVQDTFETESDYTVVFVEVKK